LGLGNSDGLVSGRAGSQFFLITSILFLTAKDKFKNTVKFGAWTGVISLIGAVVVLMLEVGIPQRAVLLYKSFVNFNSWMPIGAWSLFCGIIIFGIYALSNTEWITKKIKF
jgi:formate-dependent nitrite reductase membrane component NrfD